jgi:sporulation protein YlmC with PRC-barrel domain
MRLGDLLRRPVVDQHGREWGRVHDAHLVQDGPLLASGLAAFRVHGLVAGRTSVGTVLGYAGRPAYPPERETRGPLPIRALVRRLHRNARYVPWSAVRAVEPDRVLVEAPAEGFPRAIDA